MSSREAHNVGSVQDRWAKALNDPFNPRNYTCQGYQSDTEGRSPGNAVNSFVIEYNDDTMERLLEIRPYFYCIGYWHDYLINKKAPIQVNTEGKPCATDIEQFYVTLGRGCLKAAYAKGEGCFVGSRKLNLEAEHDPESMPLFEYIGSENSGDGVEDVGLDNVTRPPDSIMGVLKTNVRAPLPDSDVIEVQPGAKGWDQFIWRLYLDDQHPIPSVYKDGLRISEWLYSRALDGFQHGGLKYEAVFRYPNVWSDMPYSLNLEEAGEYIAALKAEAIARDKEDNDSEEASDEED